MLPDDTNHQPNEKLHTTRERLKRFAHLLNLHGPEDANIDRLLESYPDDGEFLQLAGASRELKRAIQRKRDEKLSVGD